MLWWSIEIGNNSTKIYWVYIMYKALCYELWKIQRKIRHDSCPQVSSSPLNLIRTIIKVIKESFYELWHCLKIASAWELSEEIIKDANTFSPSLTD